MGVNELRGYRLLKSASLSRQERQNILTQTNNSTEFALIRRSLRTLFADEDFSGKQPHHRRHLRAALWNDHGDYDQEEWPDEEWEPWDWSEPNYWNDEWQPEQWYEDEDPSSAAWEIDDEETPVDEEADEKEERQYREAYAIADEAARTLRDARAAVRQVRQARGYYAPESSSGKGISTSQRVRAKHRLHRARAASVHVSSARSQDMGINNALIVLHQARTEKERCFSRREKESSLDPKVSTKGTASKARVEPSSWASTFCQYYGIKMLINIIATPE